MQTFQYRLITSAFLFIFSLVQFTTAAEIQERDVCEPAIVTLYEHEYPVLINTYISSNTIINVGGIEIIIDNAPTSLSTTVIATTTVPAYVTTTSQSIVPPSPALFRIISSGSSIDITYLFTLAAAYVPLSRKRNDAKRQTSRGVSAIGGGSFANAILFSLVGHQLSFSFNGLQLVANVDPATGNIFFNTDQDILSNNFTQALFSFSSDGNLLAVDASGNPLQTQLCGGHFSAASTLQSGCDAVTFTEAAVAPPAGSSSTQLSSNSSIQHTTVYLQTTRIVLIPYTTAQVVTQSPISLIYPPAASSEPSGTPGPPIGPNIVANGAFNTSIDGWEGFQSETDPRSGNSTYSWAPDSASEPAHSPGGGQMKITLTGAQNVTGVTRVGFGSSQTSYKLDFIPDDSYYLTSWYRADGNSTTTAADLAECFVYIQPENDFTRQESSSFPLSTEWTEATFNFTGNATQFQITFTWACNQVSNEINLYLDDVAIQASTI